MVKGDFRKVLYKEDIINTPKNMVCWYPYTIVRKTEKGYEYVSGAWSYELAYYITFSKPEEERYLCTLKME